jgi:hypothetical protein
MLLLPASLDVSVRALHVLARALVFRALVRVQVEVSAENEFPAKSTSIA